MGRFCSRLGRVEREHLQITRRGLVRRGCVEHDGRELAFGGGLAAGERDVRKAAWPHWSRWQLASFPPLVGASVEPAKWRDRMEQRARRAPVCVEPAHDVDDDMRATNTKVDRYLAFKTQASNHKIRSALVSLEVEIRRLRFARCVVAREDRQVGRCRRLGNSDVQYDGLNAVCRHTAQPRDLDVASRPSIQKSLVRVAGVVYPLGVKRMELAFGAGGRRSSQSLVALHRGRRVCRAEQREAADANRNSEAPPAAGSPEEKKRRMASTHGCTPSALWQALRGSDSSGRANGSANVVAACYFPRVASHRGRSDGHRDTTTQLELESRG